MRGNHIITIKPSQWINFGWLLFGMIGIPLIIPPLIYLHKFLQIYCTSYIIYDNIIIIKTGILNVKKFELNYHRIKSSYIEEPILYRLVNLGNVTIKSSDPFTQLITFNAIQYPEIFQSSLNEVVTNKKIEHNIKEHDLYNFNP